MSAKTDWAASVKTCGFVNPRIWPSHQFQSAYVNIIARAKLNRVGEASIIVSELSRQACARKSIKPIDGARNAVTAIDDAPQGAGSW
jgi:hypothetical protein